jgi:hypothetical protein
MGRIALLTAVFYGGGDPAFNGHRPGFLDQPLRDFHRAVDESSNDAGRTLIVIEALRSLRDLKSLLTAL